jgi:predicted TPR repeat methyltransferase
MRLGAVRWQLGDSPGALAAFERAVVESPHAAEAHYNLGSAQLELGRFAEAVASAREAMRWRRGFSAALTLCAAGLAATGVAEAGVELLRQFGGSEVPIAQRYLEIAVRLMNSKLFEPARECLERVLRDQPAEVMARHLLSAARGANPDHPVDGYVRQLFDVSAASFDRELVSKLGYAIPREMIEALQAVARTPGSPWDVLDLGCGTGLVGTQIAPYSRRLTGVDLAPNMIELARTRGIYTELQCADLVTALNQSPQADYDVVTAADVFIYVGKLDATIPAIRRVLRQGGLFAFSAEALEEVETAETADALGFKLGLMGRYAHSAGYLRRLAAESGFNIELLRETCIRSEHRRPVDGWLTVWRAV